MTTKSDCGCAGQRFMPLVGDDEELIGTLFPDDTNEWLSKDVVISVRLEIRPDEAALEALIRQYRTIKEVPGSEPAQREIIAALRDAYYEMTHVSELGAKALALGLETLTSETAQWSAEIVHED